MLSGNELFLYTRSDSRLLLFLTRMHQLFPFYYKNPVRVSCRRNLFAQSVISGLLTATKRMRYNYKDRLFFSLVPGCNFYFRDCEVCKSNRSALTRSELDRICLCVGRENERQMATRASPFSSLGGQRS